MKKRLDLQLTEMGLVSSRSQAESYIKLGQVKLNGKVVKKPGQPVTATDKLELTAREKFVSRAGLKLASVTNELNISFANKTVLDVGSSTGGFTDFALQNGASFVVAVDVGTNQLHPNLRSDKRIELHEKTDIRVFNTKHKIDIVLIDVSFISLREILPSIAQIISNKTEVLAMVKPQFEATNDSLKHKGVIKNDSMRRKILKGFELWVQDLFYVVAKRDSDVAGAKGNRERFYLLKPVSKDKI